MLIKGACWQKGRYKFLWFFNKIIINIHFPLAFGHFLLAQYHKKHKICFIIMLLLKLEIVATTSKIFFFTSHTASSRHKKSGFQSLSFSHFFRWPFLIFFDSFCKLYKIIWYCVACAFDCATKFIGIYCTIMRIFVNYSPKFFQEFSRCANETSTKFIYTHFTPTLTKTNTILRRICHTATLKCISRTELLTRVVNGTKPTQINSSHHIIKNTIRPTN